jgi:uncharacterized protein
MNPTDAPNGPLGPGPRTKVRRLAERANYDREVVHAILDEGFVCHIGICTGGDPVVVPTAYVRVGECLYLHGAPANAALAGALASGVTCVTVTLVDGLVMARSAFHHSINYRSAVVYGPASDVTDPDEKRMALLEFVEHVVPGRSEGTRGPTSSELRATRVVKVEIHEAAAKIRTGGPKDEPEDLELAGVWAGEIPLRVIPQAPVPDGAAIAAMALPEHISSYGSPRP